MSKLFNNRPLRRWAVFLVYGRNRDARRIAGDRLQVLTCLMCALTVVFLSVPFGSANGQEVPQSAGSSDKAIAWVGEDAIRDADIELLMHRRRWDDTHLDANPNLRPALAETLVRRQRALQTLRRLDPISAEGRIKQTVQLWEQQVAATGQTPAEYAAKHASDERAMLTEIAWLTLWNDYIGARLTDENLEKFFNTRPFLFDGSQAEVSQIFLSDVDQRESLQQIADRIRDNAVSFKAAAKEFSEAGSADDGGYLGWIDADGDLPEVVADACLGSEAERLLPIIRSSLGLHLVYVHQMRPGHRSFAELTDHRKLRRRAASFLFDFLVRQSGDVPVRWIEPAYRPADF